MKHKVAVIGAGNLGTALAQLIATNGYTVGLWNYDSKPLEQIAKNRQSSFLRGVKLDKKIVPITDLAEAAESAEVLFLTVSSPHVRKMAAALSGLISSQAIPVSTAKGIETKTGLNMAEVMAEELKSVNRRRLTVMSGPSLANEFVEGVPTAVVLAGRDRLSAKQVRRFLENENFKVSLSSDVAGVALCGALKNIYSVALGLCEGLGYGMNAKALMATVALLEMEDLVKAVGGKKETVHGLAGHGDLMVTAFGKSRNRQFGRQLAKVKKADLLGSDKKTIEGRQACAAAVKLVQKHKLDLALLPVLDRILHKGRPPDKTVQQFFEKIEF